MKKDTIVKALSAIFVTGILTVFVIGLQTEGDAAAIGDEAVDFSLDEHKADTFHLADYIGEKPIVMTFFSTWCQPCKQQTPEVIQFQEEFGDDVEVLTIVKSESRRALERFIEESGYHEPRYLFDFNLDVSHDYGVAGQPETVIINSDGIIQDHIVGGVTRDVLAVKVLNKDE